MRFVHLALMFFLLPLSTSQAEKIWKSRSKKSQNTEKCVAVFFSLLSLCGVFLFGMDLQSRYSCFALVLLYALLKYSILLY